MSHGNKLNQAIAGKDVQTVYVYEFSSHNKKQHSADTSSRFTASAYNVATRNNRVLVIDDERMTRICIDGSSFCGLIDYNVPLLNVHINDDWFGTGILFTLYTDLALTAKEIKDIINFEFQKKTKSLPCLSFKAIDNAMLAVEI